VGEPRYHSPPNTPKRCGLRTAAAPPAWNVFTQICAAHWEGCKRVHPRSQTSSYDGLVEKMLGCGEPAQMGDSESRCLQGGEGIHYVSRSCTSSLCLRGAKVSGEHWGSQVRRRLQEGVSYRPMGRTRPAL
jgi:hypothetical protein